MDPRQIVSAHLAGVKDLSKLKRIPPVPIVPGQFHRGKLMVLPAIGDDVNQPLVTMNYDPITVAHVQKNQLLRIDTLNGLLKAGKTDVPAFPPDSIALKPTFVIASQSKLNEGRYFRLEVWPGTPGVLQAFGPEKWKQWVWVDVKEPGEGSGKGKVDTVGTSDSRKAENTYGLGNFICHQLSAQEALAVDAALGGRNVTAAGDYQILVGMHATTREITRWTWQTFWWTPEGDNPPAPSSKGIATARPDQLKGASRHYAMSIGYDMLDPPTPVNGGGDNGTPLFVFNPWLEAKFAPNVLPDSKPWKFGGKTYDNTFGIQTNCMSCHARANFGNAPNQPDYTADRYIDFAGPEFRGFLKVDFLWSIAMRAK